MLHNCSQSKPCSISIFLPDGEPSGVRLAQIAMSTIQAIGFRRSQLPVVRKTFPEIKRPGAYILIGADEKEPEQPIAYIGESEDVADRLTRHNSPKGKKSFWTDTVVLVSKDENLTKSHARYVESRLIEAAGCNPRWLLPNVKTPSKDAGGLPLPDRVTMEEFVNQSKKLVGALGWDLFYKIVRHQSTKEESGSTRLTLAQVESPIFYLDGKGYSAKMQIDPSGYFVVKTGSVARGAITKSYPHSTKILRERLHEMGVLKEEGGSLKFTSDYGFRSASAAATIVSGASANGRSQWKTQDGKAYGEWESEFGEVAA